MVPFPNTIPPALLACILAVPAWCLDSVAIVAAPVDIATLEANPYGSDKIPASFFADDTTLPASASYRGAYSLRTQLMESDGPRNWKVKLPKGSAWREYREWNFNVEPHIRHKLARDLFAAARTAPTAPRHRPARRRRLRRAASGPGWHDRAHVPLAPDTIRSIATRSVLPSSSASRMSSRIMAFTRFSPLCVWIR